MSWSFGEQQVAYEDDIMPHDGDESKYEVILQRDGDSISYVLTVNDVNEKDAEQSFICKADIVGYIVLNGFALIRVEGKTERLSNTLHPLLPGPSCIKI